MNVIPGDDILHARSHGGTDGEDKALFEGPTQQAQHAVPLRAVWEVGHTVCSWVSNTGVGVFRLFGNKTSQNRIGVRKWNYLAAALSRPELLPDWQVFTGVS